MKPKNILLVYLNHPGISYTPLDLGYALAYLRKYSPSTKIKILPINVWRKKKISTFSKDAYKIASYDANAVIFFLDNIIWSGMFYEGISFKIISKLKKLKPKIKVGFQSYKIREERSVEILKKNPELNFIFRNEAELPLLDYCTQNSFTKIKGVTYRKAKQIITNKDVRPITDLSKIPSPYLEGLFDGFIKTKIAFKKNPRFYLSASRGCPYRCHYCFRSVKFAKMRNFPIRRVLAEIKYLKEKGVKKISILDDIFMASQKHLDSFLKAYKKIFSSRQQAPALSVMTRPELLDKKTIAKFGKINVDYLHIGLQSINPEVQYLASRKNNFDPKVFELISHEAKKCKIKVKFDLIFGLPGDSLEYFKKTLDFATSLNPYSLQIKQLYLNPDTLFDLNQSEYKIKVGRKLPRNVPLVKSSQNWQPQEIKKACEIAFRAREKFKKIKFKIVSEYGYCFDK